MSSFAGTAASHRLLMAASIMRRHTSSPDLRSCREETQSQSLQLQSVSEMMLEHYLKGSLTSSPSLPKTVFAALASKAEPVDLAIGSTLQFKDGRIDRGNAKEIFLGIVHGRYTDDDYLDLVEDFLNIQDIIIPSKVLLAWMMDAFFEADSTKHKAEGAAVQNSNARGNLSHSIALSSSQLPSTCVQSNETLQAKIVQTKSKASLALPLQNHNTLFPPQTQTPRDQQTLLTTPRKPISPLTSPMHTARRAIAASNSVVVGRRVAKPGMDRSNNISLKDVKGVQDAAKAAEPLRKSADYIPPPSQKDLAHAPTAPPSTRGSARAALPQTSVLNQPAACDDSPVLFTVSPALSDGARTEPHELFIEKQPRVLFLLEIWLDLSSYECALDEELTQTVRNFTSDIAYRSKFKPEGMKLLSLLQDALMLQRLMPGAHLSVKENIGRMVARLISSSKLVANDLFVVKEMVAFLCTRLDIDAKQANVLLNRSHAAGFTQKLPDRHDVCRMLPPFDLQSLRSALPTPPPASDLLSIEPLLIAEAITLHESRLFSLVAPAELTSLRRGTHIAAMLEWEQKMGERLTLQVRKHHHDKKSRVDAVVHALKIARACLEAHRNFQAAFAIWKALNADELCKKLLAEHEKAGGRGLIELLRITTDPKDDHAGYRSRLANLQPPALPYLPFVLRDIARVEEELADEMRQMQRHHVPKPAAVVLHSPASTPTPRQPPATVVAPPAPILSFEKLRALAQIRAYISAFQASTLYYDIPSDRVKILEPFFGSLP